MNSCQFATFNCKNIKRSVDEVRLLCRTCAVVCLQETWLPPHDIPYIGTVDSSFAYTATSAMDMSVGMRQGRPFGGVAVLWRCDVFQRVTIVQCNNDRICAIKIEMCDRAMLIFSVYLPTCSDKNLTDFIDCLSAVNTIIEEQGIETAFILGDFNADPGELFYSELISMCKDQKWSCIDTDMLGLNSGTFTFTSLAYGSTSWLDHCIATHAARRVVSGVKVLYGARWSDHCPLTVVCDLELLTPKVTPQIVDTNKNLLWGVRNRKQIAMYASECHQRLGLIDFPSECVECADCFCDNRDHRRVLDRLYCDIVTALQEAAVRDRGGVRVRGGGPRIVGWNKHVSEAHRRARDGLKQWIMSGKPNSGSVYLKMCETRKIFKSRLKWCQVHQEQLQIDAMVEKHSRSNITGFWKETNKMNVRPGLPVSINDVSDPKAIANMFKNISW